LKSTDNQLYEVNHGQPRSMISSESTTIDMFDLSRMYSEIYESQT